MRRALGPGDFEIRATVTLSGPERSAASVRMGEGHFGLEGATGKPFVEGGIFGGLHLFKENSPPRDEVVELFCVRSNGILICGWGETVVFRGEVDAEAVLWPVALRPHRAELAISEFTVQGALTAGPDLPEFLVPGYSIPLVDLDGRTELQTVVDREDGQYLGHPTTVLLDDGKTILCVYPKGHGKGPIVLKRSEDGGKTWSKRLPTPKSWETSLETPTIHRVEDADGTRRLIVFSGLFPVRMARSEDEGLTWSELEPIGAKDAPFGGIVAMGCVIPLHDAPGHYAAFFHDDGRFIDGSGRASQFYVYQTESKDGGLTWGPPRVVAHHPLAHLCEPGFVRSPDGKRLALLLRENSRRFNSFVMFSDDEAATWSKPRQLPAALTGDRHTASYLEDGRLFVTFRDTTRSSTTKGDWVAWIGSWSDIVTGDEGSYRIRLKDNKHRWDCAYPGLVRLPDGNLVTTTYGHWDADKQPYILSVRFDVGLADAMFETLR